MLSVIINPQRACTRGYSSLSLSQSLFILEKAPLSGLKLTSVYILGDDLSP